MILWSVRGWGLNLLLVISEKGTSVQSKFNPVHPVNSIILIFRKLANLCIIQVLNTVLNNRQ